MERPNSPEKKTPKLYDNCMSCESRYELTEDNTMAQTFARQPECNYLYCVCPHCNFRTKLFCDESSLQHAEAKGIYILERDYADETTYQEWVKVKGIELPKEYELTDRHEKIIKGFGETLRNMPDDFFWDNIEEPTERPYPNTWI